MARTSSIATACLMGSVFVKKASERRKISSRNSAQKLKWLFSRFPQTCWNTSLFKIQSNLIYPATVAATAVTSRRCLWCLLTLFQLLSVETWRKCLRGRKFQLLITRGVARNVAGDLGSFGAKWFHDEHLGTDRSDTREQIAPMEPND